MDGLYTVDCDAAFARIADIIENDATVVRHWPLQGGISAGMTALELVAPGPAGEARTRRVIIRQPGDWALAVDPRAARREFRVLEALRRAGVPAPKPLLLDESGAILPRRYLVVGYIEGEPVHSPPDIGDFVRQMAAAMAQVHRVDATEPEIAAITRRGDWLDRAPVEREVEEDEALEPRRIRAALRTVVRPGQPLPHANPPALLHGDPWPGNLVWRDGRLVALIDWEEAHVGDPLEDLSIARFDVLCMLGWDAMEQLTEAYAALQPQVDPADLPTWDLYTALRPLGEVSAWADGWADLGRPDITEEVLRAYHREFVAQALAGLGS